METGTAIDEQRLQEVGESFLVAYYKLASEDTAELHKFYRKNAVGSFGDATQIAGSVKIGEKLAVLSGAIFDLETGGITYSFQPTPEGSLLIMVSGLVQLRSSSGKHEAPKRFVQTFHLVGTSKDNSSYAIANDLHRFLNTSSDAKAPLAGVAAPAPAAVAAPGNGQQQTPVPAQTAPAAPAKVEAEAVKKDEPKAQSPATPAVAPVAAPAAPKEKEHEKPKAPAVTESAASPQPAKQQQHQDRQPKSKAASGNPAPAPEKKAEAPAPAKPSGPPSYSQVAAKSSPQQATGNGLATASAPVPKREAPAPQAASPASPSSGGLVYIKGGAAVAPKLLTDYLTSTFGPVVSLTTKGAAAVAQMSNPRDADTLVAVKEIEVDGVALQLEVARSGASSSRGGNSGSQRRQAPADGSRRSASSGNATSSGGASKERTARPQQGSGATNNSSSRPSPRSSPAASKPSNGPRSGAKPASAPAAASN